MKKAISLLPLLFILNVAYSQTGWFEQSSGTTNNLRAVHFVNSETGFVVGAHGTVLKTTNGGANWILTDIGASNFLADLYFVNSNTGYVVSYNSNQGTIFKTTNGGENWNIILFDDHRGFHCTYFINANTGYAGGRKWVFHPPYWQFLYAFIYKTTNGGSNWLEPYLSTVDGSNCRSLYFINETGYASIFSTVSSSYINKTTNSGINWTQMNSPMIESLFFTSKDTGHAVYTTGKCYKTTNGGSNWVLNQLSNSALHGIHFPSPDTGYIVGYGQAIYIYKTTNGGINWIAQNLLAYLSSVFFINNNVGYAVGLNGRIFKTTTGGVVTNITPLNSGFPKSIYLHQNYPNPFNPTTQIRFDVPRLSHFKLIIYDALGREVAKLVNEKLNAGSYETKWDGKDYPSGVYFYKLITDEYVDTKKMILLK